MEQENQSHSADIRKKILQAAGELMTQKGIKETSLKDISKHSGISAGTLYYYYSAKEDIICDIADNNLNKITDGLLDWIDTVDENMSHEQILKTVFERILAATTRGKLHLYLIGDAETSANGELKRRITDRYAQWRKTLIFGFEKVLKDGASADGSLACLIIAAIDGLIIQNMFCGDEPLPIDGVVKLIINSFA